MPYHSAGYGTAFYTDSIYWIVLIPVLLLSVWAQAQVSGSFSKYSRDRNRRGVTGAQAAYDVLRAHGVFDVSIKPCRGKLTDHYDPRDNTIYLSEPVYNRATVAAVGVAAHEAGHAVQYAVGYGPVRVRSTIIPITQFGSQFAFIALVLGLALYSQPLFAVGIVLFGATTVFQLVTLPVEFDASHRAIQILGNTGILYGDEIRDTRKVLSAAAMTYVAAAAASILSLLRLLILFGGRRNRD